MSIQKPCVALLLIGTIYSVNTLECYRGFGIVGQESQQIEHCRPGTDYCFREYEQSRSLGGQIKLGCFSGIAPIHTGMMDDGCTTVDRDGARITTCYCAYDYCNSATSISSLGPLMALCTLLLSYML
ncbi:hypothetical protein TCAL_08840 [Tigriopus californicus]|uniref:Uncharacterized protein n=1 Tax=Tigriopus californicus TaxID=6832 RepID=A0A553PNN4_TIGCA|nr:hypothetical protein TCAL_08840 [Tigriopus californicus]|eukprot:TCALIF_08840-PA protein Name:"Protein of unknown function" AED:0.00 eAED:0.00 QI:106/1/1/1/0.5/0.66/3/59/126